MLLVDNNNNMQKPKKVGRKRKTRKKRKLGVLNPICQISIPNNEIVVPVTPTEQQVISVLSVNKRCDSEVICQPYSQAQATKKHKVFSFNPQGYNWVFASNNNNDLHWLIRSEDQTIIFINKNYLQNSTSGLFQYCSKYCNDELDVECHKEFRQFQLLTYHKNIWISYLEKEKSDPLKIFKTVEEKMEYGDFLYYVADSKEIRRVVKEIGHYLLVEATQAMLLLQIRSSRFWHDWIVPRIGSISSVVDQLLNSSKFKLNLGLLVKIGKFIARHELYDLAYHLIRIISQSQATPVANFILDCGLRKQWFVYSLAKFNVRKSDIFFQKGELVLVHDLSRKNYEVVILSDIKRFIDSPSPRPQTYFHFECRDLDKANAEDYRYVLVERNARDLCMNRSLFALNLWGIENWIMLGSGIQWFSTTLTSDKEESCFKKIMMEHVLKDLDFSY
jgi:hypothetical protein